MNMVGNPKGDTALLRDGLTYHDFIAQDVKPAPASILEQGGEDLGLRGIARESFIGKGFLEQENKLLWPFAWQMACREEELPEVGDVSVYEIADYSFIVVRSAPDRINAYYNACLHRGTKLCAADTSVDQFRCPFHGFTWNLDGTLQDVPLRWDFPQVTDDEYRLPEAKVATWGGFVFINMNPNAAPLETYLANLPDHLLLDRFEDKYIKARYRKVLPANWKAALEAFLEAYHSAETHPQGLGLTDHGNGQYDVWPGNPHISRFMHAFGIQSPMLGRDLSQEDILETLYQTIWSEAAPTLPADTSARSFFAAETRQRMAAATGRDYTWASDAESIDSIEYFAFPNLVLFHGLFVPLVYRFRPYKDDPNRCIFDLILLADAPIGQPRPEPAPVIDMGEKSFTEQLGGFFGNVYDQDTGNLGLQQDGMRAARFDNLTLSHYQEVRIRHFHQTLDRYLGATD